MPIDLVIDERESPGATPGVGSGNGGGSLKGGEGGGVGGGGGGGGGLPGDSNNNANRSSNADSTSHTDGASTPDMVSHLVKHPTSVSSTLFRASNGTENESMTSKLQIFIATRLNFQAGFGQAQHCEGSNFPLQILSSKTIIALVK